jgi:hypothetical protein
MKTFITNIPPERAFVTAQEPVIAPRVVPAPRITSNQDEIDRRTAEVLCGVVTAASGRTITPDQLLADARRLSHTNT